MRKELTERGLVFADVFARFGVANRRLDYADASTAGYPATPSSRTWGIGPNQRGARTQAWKINHLATRYFSFVPGNRAVDDREAPALDHAPAQRRARLARQSRARTTRSPSGT